MKTQKSLAITISFSVLLLCNQSIIIAQSDGLAANTVASAEAVKFEDPKEFELWLDDFIAENSPNVESNRIAFVLVKGDRIFFQKGYGFVDAEKKTSVSPEDTVFLAASVSKVFTATAIMQLVEQGKIRLDDDINRYLKRFQIKSDFEQPITIAHLLTHTSGLDEYFIGALAPNDAKPLSMGDYFSRKNPVRVLPAGEQIIYSNQGIGLAGHIVEEVSGMPFEEYVEQNIFAPLSMDKSSFRQPLPKELLENLADARARQAPAIVLSPSGSLAMTNENIARFIVAQLNGGKFDDGQILQNETLAEMHRRQFSPNPQMPGATYGFFESFANGRRAIYHTGDRGHHSLLYLLPEEKIGFYLVQTGGDANAALFREKLTEEFLNRFFPASEKFKLTNPPADFQTRAMDFVGTYRIGGYSRTTLTKIAGLPQQISITDNAHETLNAELFGGELKTKLVEVEPNLFRSEDGGYFDFQRDENGKIKRLFISGGISDPMTAERIAWYENVRLHIGIIIGGILLVVSRLLIVPLGFLLKRIRKNKIVSKESKFLRTGWRLSGIFASLIALTPLILLAWLFTREQPVVYEIPPAISIALTLLFAASLLGFILPLWAVRAWREKSWTLPKRVYFTLFALAAFIMPFFLNYWNLLGFRY